jgi:hypothetical protein
MQADVEFAENSPFPPPELAAQGVYCEGCHTVEAIWKRPMEDLMPPRSSVKAEWLAKPVAGKGAQRSAAGKASVKSKAGKPARVPTGAKGRR